MCGVFGVIGHPEAANLAYLGLHALQHRGQESAGIASSNGAQLFVHRAMGLVHDVFSQRELERLPGDAAIGHVRYSTAGGSHVRNAQPIAVDYARGSLAVVHNGNLTNARELRERLEERGSIFQSNSDTEVIVHLIAGALHQTMEDRVSSALSGVRGAYSLLFLTEDAMIAVRDPLGFRPLCLGQLQVGDGNTAYLVASEPPSFDLIGARFVRDVKPGEMLIATRSGLTSRFPFAPSPPRACVFEYIYFARPDSVLNGLEVYAVRKALGRRLAIEQPVEADVVIPLPDSGVHAAMGFAEQANIPFEMGLIRSRYVGRTFIEPQQSIRHFGVRLKFNPVAGRLAGRRVVVVDDSIVRGTTIRKISTMLRGVGATEVHVRISSPPVLWPCYYGIDTPTRKELIASSHSVGEIGRHVGATSLGYLSVDAMLEAIRSEGNPSIECGFCDACFTGDYPVSFDSLVPPHRMRIVSQ